MANKKYIGKVINMPPTVSKEFAHVRTIVAARIGFEPSASETIAYLITQFKNQCAQASLSFKVSPTLSSSPSSESPLSEFTTEQWSYSDNQLPLPLTVSEEVSKSDVSLGSSSTSIGTKLAK